MAEKGLEGLVAEAIAIIRKTKAVRQANHAPKGANDTDSLWAGADPGWLTSICAILNTISVQSIPLVSGFFGRSQFALRLLHREKGLQL